MHPVGQGLDRGHHDRVAGVHPEWIDVLHGAHGDARVVGIAHDLVLDLLPPHEAALNEHLADGAGAEPAAHPFEVGGLGRHDAAPTAAQGERRPDDGREPHPLQCSVRGCAPLDLVGPLDDFRRWVWLADLIQQVTEPRPVLGHLDRLERRAEQRDARALKDPLSSEGDCEVQGGLPAQSGEDAVGPLARDDPFDHLDRERLQVHHVRHAGVGHDRGRVGIEQDGADAFLPQGAAGLRSGIVELRRLADHDRSRPEDEDGLRPGPRWRGCPLVGVHAVTGRIGCCPPPLTCSTNRSNTSSASSGPGDPSGWY